MQGIEGLVEVLDTELDPVRIVAASPDPKILEKGGLGGRKLIIASEYEALARKWADSKAVPYTFLRAYGATESLPPEVSRARERKEGGGGKGGGHVTGSSTAASHWLASPLCPPPESSIFSPPLCRMLTLLWTMQPQAAL